MENLSGARAYTSPSDVKRTGTGLPSGYRFGGTTKLRRKKCLKANARTQEGFSLGALKIRKKVPRITFFVKDRGEKRYFKSHKKNDLKMESQKSEKSFLSYFCIACQFFEASVAELVWWGVNRSFCWLALLIFTLGGTTT